MIFFTDSSSTGRGQRFFRGKREMEKTQRGVGGVGKTSSIATKRNRGASLGFCLCFSVLFFFWKGGGKRVESGFFSFFESSLNRMRNDLHIIFSSYEKKDYVEARVKRTQKNRLNNRQGNRRHIFCWGGSKTFSMKVREKFFLSVFKRKGRNQIVADTHDF